MSNDANSSITQSKMQILEQKLKNCKKRVKEFGNDSTDDYKSLKISLDKIINEANEIDPKTLKSQENELSEIKKNAKKQINKLNEKVESHQNELRKNKVIKIKDLYKNLAKRDKNVEKLFKERKKYVRFDDFAIEKMKELSDINIINEKHSKYKDELVKKIEEYIKMFKLTVENNDSKTLDGIQDKLTVFAEKVKEFFYNNEEYGKVGIDLEKLREELSRVNSNDDEIIRRKIAFEKDIQQCLEEFKRKFTEYETANKKSLLIISRVDKELNKYEKSVRDFGNHNLEYRFLDEMILRQIFVLDDINTEDVKIREKRREKIRRAKSLMDELKIKATAKEESEGTSSMKTNEENTIFEEPENSKNSLDVIENTIAVTKLGPASETNINHNIEKTQQECTKL